MNVCLCYCVLYSRKHTWASHIVLHMFVPNFQRNFTNLKFQVWSSASNILKFHFLPNSLFKPIYDVYHTKFRASLHCFDHFQFCDFFFWICDFLIIYVIFCDFLGKLQKITKNHKIQKLQIIIYFNLINAFGYVSMYKNPITKVFKKSQIPNPKTQKSQKSQNLVL